MVWGGCQVNGGKKSLGGLTGPVWSPCQVPKACLPVTGGALTARYWGAFPARGFSLLHVRHIPARYWGVCLV